MSPDLDAIRQRAERYAQAIGPGGEKAWVAGLLAADVPVLLAALAAVEQDRDRLSERLAAAETVCTIFGWTGYTEEGKREKAAVQAYMDWANAYSAPRPTPEWRARVAELAARRDATREKTLAAIRAEHSATEADPTTPPNDSATQSR